MFYQGVPIYHCLHVIVTVDQSSSESEYNASFTAGIYITHFRMIHNEFLSKYPYVVPEKPPLVILDRKSSICWLIMVRTTKTPYTFPKE